MTLDDLQFRILANGKIEEPQQRQEDWQQLITEASSFFGAEVNLVFDAAYDSLYLKRLALGD